MLPSYVGHLVLGAAAGVAAGFFVFPSLFPGYLSQETIWHYPVAGGALGAIVGLVVGQVSERRKAARVAALEQVAMRAGASFARSDAKLEQALRRDLPELNGGVSNVLRRTERGMEIAVGELVVITRHGPRQDDRVESVEQTVAHAELPGLGLPRLTLQPRGPKFTLLAGLADPGIPFPEDPAFEREYVLLGSLHGKALFDEAVRAWFKSRPGLRLECSGGSLLLYWRGRVLPPEQHGEIASLAAELFALLAARAKDG